jgi:hypothetical protein
LMLSSMYVQRWTMILGMGGYTAASSIFGDVEEMAIGASLNVPKNTVC